jgi:hypothetical protein
MASLTDIDLISQMLLPGRPPRYSSTEEELLAIREGVKPVSMFSFGSTICHEFINLIERTRTLGLRAMVTDRISSIKSLSKEAVVVYVSSDSEQWRAEALSIVWQSTLTFGMSDSTLYVQSRLLGYSHEDAEEWVHSRYTHSLFFLLTQKHRNEIVARKGRSLRLTQPDASKVFYICDAFARMVPPTKMPVLESATLGRVRVSGETLNAVFNGVSPCNNILLAKCTHARVRIIDESMESNIQLLSEGQWI